MRANIRLASEDMPDIGSQGDAAAIHFVGADERDWFGNPPASRSA